ncbi:Probable diguanylate cyclase YfiN [Arthrobacter agilis]|uniref:GGDEF domain-containing protein n=1 Tax=Arthrobacter agilis TaxID=37921 RepID=UPI000B559962|nr:GGDEF domain-containing protein [Arthrobacter agilis]OUM42150.1 hypothetical protein B8W74_08505 [Arthrobacter agilis]VDR33558.1 Probable diguanylate cyclase YfiN [Arthrobacter agilis]
MTKLDAATEGGSLLLAQERDLIGALEDAEICIDLPRAVAEAAAIQAVAESLGRTDVALWAEITKLDALARSDGTRDAVARGTGVLAWATEQGDARLASRCHALLGMMNIIAGLSGAGAEHATIAVTLLDGTERPRLRAKLLTRQAVGLFAAGLPGHGFDVSRRAMLLAEDLDDLELMAQLASNAYHAAMDELMQDEADSWVATIDRVIEAAPELEAGLSDVLIRSHVAAGRPEDALVVLDRYGMDATPASQPELRASRKLLLAQIHLGLGNLDLALESLDEAQELIELHELEDIGASVLEERATLAAAQGDFQRAYELHRTFHGAARRRWIEARRSEVDHRFAEQNVTEAILRAEEAEAAVAVDPLTRIPNRRWVEDSLPDIINSWQVDGGPAGALAILDLDHFKLVNDRYGHAAGDDVLVAVATCLQECRGVRHVARIGGEEFLLVLDRDADQQGVVLQVLDTLRELRWPHIHLGLCLTASIGIARCTPGTQTAGLLREADRNLYRAKREGRDRAVGPW